MVGPAERNDEVVKQMNLKTILYKKSSEKFRGFFYYQSFSSGGIVLIPKILYIGQKSINAVANKTPPAISNINPIVPVITSIKYSAAKTTDRMILTNLSMYPMLFFIRFYLIVFNKFLNYRKPKKDEKSA